MGGEERVRTMDSSRRAGTAAHKRRRETASALSAWEQADHRKAWRQVRGEEKAVGSGRFQRLAWMCRWR